MKEMIVKLRNFLYNEQYSHYNYCYCYNYPAWIPLAHSVSVLELKLSDWFMSPDRWCFNKSGFFWELFFFFLFCFFNNSCLFSGSEGKFGNRWSRLLSVRVLHEIRDPSGPEPRSTSARCHSVLITLQRCGLVCAAAQRRWSLALIWSGVFKEINLCMLFT